LGAALGQHARYRTVCTIDFAGGYAERSDLVAKNPQALGSINFPDDFRSESCPESAERRDRL
jgi:hypothetical protein